MTKLRTFRLALAGATFLSLAGHAFALDGNDLLTKINAALAVQSSGSVKADTVKVDGSTVTLAGTKFQPPDKEAVAVAIGDIKLENVEEDGEGGYSIETIKFADINVNQDRVNVTASDISLGGVAVPADTTKKTIDSLLFYETGHVGPVKVAKDGAEVFSLAETTIRSTLRDDAGIDFDMKAKGLKADLSKVDDPKSKEAIEKLALQSLDGEISMNGGWELASGKLDVEEFAVDFKNVGRLDLAFSLSGYTLDLIYSMQESVKAMEANPNKEEAQQAAGLAMLGLMQQLSFVSAEVRFEDASITKRALDYAGSQQGISGAQLAQSLKGMVPLMVAQLNVPDLQNAISTAVNAYLDNPKSFTVSATPDKPVPFPMIMGAAMGAPNTIPQVLGVKVTAND